MLGTVGWRERRRRTELFLGEAILERAITKCARGKM